MLGRPLPKLKESLEIACTCFLHLSHRISDLDLSATIVPSALVDTFRVSSRGHTTTTYVASRKRRAEAEEMDNAANGEQTDSTRNFILPVIVTGFVSSSPRLTLPYAMQTLFRSSSPRPTECRFMNEACRCLQHFRNAHTTERS